MADQTGTADTRVPMETVIEGLNDLLQLDHDAVGAYDVALENVADGDHALRIEAFRQDHERHIRDLNDVILALGGVPANEPHAAAPIRQTIEELMASVGDDALLAAWRRNEQRITGRYTDYAREAVFWPPAAKRVIDQNALDEEKHLRWVDGVLGIDSEKDTRKKLDEGMDRARATLSEVQDRLQDASRKGKASVAGTLASAANRLDQFAVDQQSDRGIRGTARRTALKLSDSLEHAAESLAGADEDRHGGPTLTDRVEEVVRERPIAAVAGAFVGAFVIGRILR